MGPILLGRQHQLPSSGANTESRIGRGPGPNAWPRQNRLGGTARSL